MTSIAAEESTYLTTGAEVRIVLIREVHAMPKLDHSEEAVRYWYTHVRKSAWFDEEREMLVVLNLNVKHRVGSFSLVSLGTLNESIAHPRDVFRSAIAHNAFGIIVMHNHPSGEPDPSPSDVAVTHRIFCGSQILRIRFFDHIIVGSRSNYFSFLANDMLEGGMVPKTKGKKKVKLRKSLERGGV